MRMRKAYPENPHSLEQGSVNAEHYPIIFGDFGDKLTGFFRSFWDGIWDADINLSLPAPVKLVIGGEGVGQMKVV